MSADVLRKVSSDVGPRLDEKCAVKVFEDLGFIAVLEQPDVRLDTGLTVQKVVRAPRAAGITDSQWGKQSSESRKVRSLSLPKTISEPVVPPPR